MTSEKKNRRWMIVTFGILFTGMGVAIIFFVFRNSIEPQSGKQFIVSVSQPLDQGRYPAFQQIPVDVAINTDLPIKKLELWVNGELVDSHVPSTARTSMYHFWHWTPGYIGEHTLFVRATNYLGGSAESNIVHVVGVLPAGFNTIVVSDGGLTLASLAAESQASVNEILAQNPGFQLGTNEAIPTGQFVAVPQNPWAALDLTVSQPVGIEALDLPEGTLIADIVEPGFAVELTGGWFGNLFNTSRPDSPQVQADVAACSTRLLITDTSIEEDGFYVYRLQSGTGGFVRVATLASRDLAGPLLFEETSLPGTHQYYVAAFNAGGEATSNVVSISTPDDCQSEPGIAKIKDWVDVPEGVEQGMYFYYSVNGVFWKRYPANPHAFLSPESVIDFGLLTGGASGGSSVVLGEAWAWVGDELHFLGNFGQNYLTPPDQETVSLVPAIGLIADTTLEVRSEFYKEDQDLQAEGLSPISLCDQESLNQFGAGICNNREWDTFQMFSELGTTTFRWRPGMHVNMGVWQVSLNPFPEDGQLDPQGVILTGKTYGLGFGGLASGETGVFEIDLSQVNLDKIVEAAKQTSVEVNQQIFEPYTPPWQKSGLSVGPGPAQALGLTTSDELQVLPADVPDYNHVIYGEGLRRVYVRIIPMNDGQIAGMPSNANIVYWNPDKYIPPGDEIDYNVRITDFNHFGLPERGLEYCIQITGVDKQKMKEGMDPYGLKPLKTNQEVGILYEEFESYRTHGDPLCPKLHQPEKRGFGYYFNDAMGKMSAAWDWVAKTYNFLSEQIDEWGAKLNPLCIQGSLIEGQVSDSDSDWVHQACKTGTKYAKTAILASYGIPPSLPESEELKERGIDYAVEQAAEEIGPECNDACKEYLREGISHIVNDLGEQETQVPSCIGEALAQAEGYEPLCLPAGVAWKPFPAGQFYPALVLVEVTRPLNPPEGTLPPGDGARACILHVDLRTVVNNYWADNNITISKPINISSNKNDDGDWVGVPITADQVRWLHEPEAVLLPVLQPGESMQVPVQLYRSKQDYKLPGQSLLELGKDYWRQYHGMTYELNVTCGEFSDYWDTANGQIPVSEVPWLTDAWGVAP